MRNAKTLMVALVAVFAFGAIAASAASATLPEFSAPCYHVEKGTGEYPTEAACLKSEKAGEEPKEWVSENNAPFTSTGGEAKLKVPGVPITVTCKESTDSGKILPGASKKEGKVTVTFEKCKASGSFPCHNIGAPALSETIVTEELKMVLGYIKSTTPKEVGVDLKPASGAYLAKFECEIGSPFEVVEVIDSVIGKITPINTLVKKFEALFTESGGIQVPTKFEAEPEDTLFSEVTTDGVKGMPLASTEKTTDTITLTHEMQIKA